MKKIILLLFVCLGVAITVQPQRVAYAEGCRAGTDCGGSDGSGGVGGPTGHPAPPPETDPHCESDWEVCEGNCAGVPWPWVYACANGCDQTRQGCWDRAAELCVDPHADVCTLK